jgi:DNA polymerase III subunit beta
MTTATAERKRRRTGTGITLSAASLRKALHAVSAAVSTRSPKPILLNVLLANGGLTGTDLELQVNAEIAYTGDPILLPHHRLQAILNACPKGEEVSLTPGDTTCVVTVDGATWTLPTEDAKEFPQWEADSPRSVCRIPADQFARAAKAVMYATDNESSRFALGGVMLEVADGVVTFVATDGRRLSAAEVEIDQAVDDSKTLIPRKAMATIAAAAGNSPGSVQIEATDNEVVATIDGTVITARLLSGRFPPWRDAIPQFEESPTAAVISELLSATMAAAIVTSEVSKGVDFTFSENGIWLHGKSSEAGESSVTCPIMEFGHGCTVKLDPRFVAEFLRSLPADGEPTVSLHAKDSDSAVVFRCEDFTGVVMPLAKD